MFSSAAGAVLSTPRARRVDLPTSGSPSPCTSTGRGGLIASAITNPIPVFDWLSCAVPAALAGLLSRGREEEPLVPALLAAVPAAAVNALGWSVAGGPDAGLRMAAFSGIGLLVGLGVAMAVGERGPTARPSRRS